MMLLLATVAMALDCTSLNAESCDAANAIAAQIQAHTGSAYVTDDAAQQRLRTSTLYDAIEGVRQVAIANRCTVDGLVLEGTLGGAYGRGTWSTDWADQTSSGTASGTWTGNGRWEGSYSGGTLGTILAHHKRQRIAGDRDGDFLMGGYARTSGRRGVAWAVHGVCPGNMAEAFTDWFPGGLEPYYQLQCSVPPTSCLDAQLHGNSSDGPLLIDPDGLGPLDSRMAYCDQSTDGGGWTLVRNSAPGPNWGPFTDDLRGTAALGVYSPTWDASTHFTAPWDHYGAGRLLFRARTGSTFCVLDGAAASAEQHSLSLQNVTVQASAGGLLPAGASTNVLMRTNLFVEDPWIGCSGTHADNLPAMLYGEGSNTDHSSLRNAVGGIGVFQIEDRTPDLFNDDDGDGLQNGCDPCPASADHTDSDGDGVCDTHDACVGDDSTGDSDGDGVCDDSDLCVGDDLSGDADGDGSCANLDCDDGSAARSPFNEEHCDGSFLDEDCNAASSDAGMVTFWDFAGPNNFDPTVVFSPTTTGTVRVCDSAQMVGVSLATPSIQVQVQGHSTIVRASAFNPVGTMHFDVSLGSTLGIRDVQLNDASIISRSGFLEISNSRLSNFSGTLIDAERGRTTIDNSQLIYSDIAAYTIDNDLFLTNTSLYQNPGATRAIVVADFGGPANGASLNGVEFTGVVSNAIELQLVGTPVRSCQIPLGTIVGTPNVLTCFFNGCLTPSGCP